LQRRHGDITVPNGALGKVFSSLFEGTPLAPISSDDFLSASWRKLVFNSPAVIFALTLKPAGVVRDESIATLMKAIAREAIAVGRAAGATLDDAIAGEAVERYRTAAPDWVNSLLADRLAKRPLEVDARNGVIVRLGRRYGIETPLNEMAVTLLEASMDRSLADRTLPPAAESFVAKGAWVSHLVLVETACVLDSVFELDHEQLAIAIELLLNHRQLVVQDPDVVALALAHYRQRPKLGFSHCLILEVARKAGQVPVGTFDREFAKSEGTELQPRRGR
jgi:predicted nucleic-acid-binding protein